MPPLLDNPAAAQSYLWAIILLPLAGALVNGLFGRRLGRGNVGLIGLAMVGGSFLLSCVAFAWVAGGTNLHFVGDWWFRVVDPSGRAPIAVPWGLLVDRLSGTLLLIVTGVGFLIHLYSVGYMSHEDDAGYARFFTYLNLFIAAMLTLVMGDNLVLTFVGWEGVGLASYLLIGFWYTDEEKAYAGRKAFVTNRVGDFGFLLGLFAIYSIFGTAEFGQLAAKTLAVRPDWVLTSGVFAGWTLQGAITFATLGLFVGAAGKSAQIPLYVWLPDAMAGPTPVSALIHAATMVTAGVYLVARTNFLFVLAPASMAVVTIIGAATALFAAIIAFAQYDLKRVLAYSTVSQLGFMFIGVGSGAYFAGVYHLMTHAFFKACLFLGAGSVMHAHARRPRHPEHGRPLEEDALHGEDLPRRHARHHRHRPALRLLLEGRHPGRRALQPQRRLAGGGQDRLRARHAGRRRDLLLHDARLRAGLRRDAPHRDRRGTPTSPTGR